MRTGLTLDGLLADRLASNPSTPWLIDETGSVSAARAEAMIGERAARLAADLPRGSRLVVSIPNSIEAALSLFAAVRAGMVWVGVHPRSSAAMSEQIRKVVGAAHLVDRSAAELDRVEGLGPRSGDPYALAVVAFTSGTSGRPKGVMHSQHNICLPAVVAAERISVAPVIGMYLALTSINMQILGPIQALVSGGCCVCLATSESAAVADAVQRYSITSLPMAAATAFDWVNGAARADQLATLSAPVVGGSGMAETVIDGYAARFGHRLTVGYGLTEAPTSVCREPLDEPRVPGSSGRALPHLRVSARDAAGDELPPGEIGELCVEAADERYRPMLGYWDDPVASAAALRADPQGRVRLHTGDRGRIDAAGYVHVLGRGDDVIVRGGVNVGVEGVEDCLRRAPGVADAAVVGVADPRLGQVPVALVVFEGPPRFDRIEQWCIQHLTAPERPVDIVAVESIARSPMGKIRRRALRAELGGMLGQRRAVEAIDVGPAEHGADQQRPEDDG